VIHSPVIEVFITVHVDKHRPSSYFPSCHKHRLGDSLTYCTHLARVLAVGKWYFFNTVPKKIKNKNKFERIFEKQKKGWSIINTEITLILTPFYISWFIVCCTDYATLWYSSWLHWSGIRLLSIVDKLNTEPLAPHISSSGFKAHTGFIHVIKWMSKYTFICNPQNIEKDNI